MRRRHCPRLRLACRAGAAARRLASLVAVLVLPLTTAVPPARAAGAAPGPAAAGGQTAPGPSGAAATGAQPSRTPPAPVHPQVQQLPANRTIAVLGQPVTGPDGAVIGRLVDVLVNAAGVPEAGVIDFGGFMGVGSRIIAVRWDTLRFHPGAPHDRVSITLLPAEIAAAPQFKGTHLPAPVVVRRPDGGPASSTGGATPPPATPPSAVPAPAAAPAVPAAPAAAPPGPSTAPR